jgi:hypothetical protein
VKSANVAGRYNLSTNVAWQYNLLSSGMAHFWASKSGATIRRSFFTRDIFAMGGRGD